MALFVGVRQVQLGALSLGNLLLVMGYLAQLYEPMKTLGKKSATLQGHLASVERAFFLLDQTPDLVEKPNARPIHRSTGGIVCQNVSFDYTSDAPREIGRFFKDDHKVIVPLTVREILDEEIAMKLA